MPCYQSTTLPGGVTTTGRTGYKTEADCLNACREGACCEGTTCTVKPQCQCQGPGKVFNGVGTVCTPNPCTACCAGDRYPVGGDVLINLSLAFPQDSFRKPLLYGTYTNPSLSFTGSLISPIGPTGSVSSHMVAQLGCAQQIAGGVSAVFVNSRFASTPPAGQANTVYGDYGASVHAASVQAAVCSDSAGSICTLGLFVTFELVYAIPSVFNSEESRRWGIPPDGIKVGSGFTNADNVPHTVLFTSIAFGVAVGTELRSVVSSPNCFTRSLNLTSDINNSWIYGNPPVRFASNTAQTVGTVSLQNV